MFFFNNTATTEIYTYGHTLPRHDARPISQTASKAPAAKDAAAIAPAATAPMLESIRPLTSAAGRTPFTAATSALTLAPRSEEHTSELQSLMRISYAVFCLKKKKTPEDYNYVYQNSM